MSTLRTSILLFIFIQYWENGLTESNNIQKNTEIEAEKFVLDVNDELNNRKNLETEANWKYASNITEENEKFKNQISLENAIYYKDLAEKARKFKLDSISDESIKRQLYSLSRLGYSALDENDYGEIVNAIDKMEGNYAKVKICSYTDRTKCDLTLDPEIEEIFVKSRDPEELKYYWVEFYNKAGTPTRKYFEKYLELNKKAAILNDFQSGAEMWLDEYEDDTFEEQLEKIFTDIKPLYDQIHGYVRWRLRQKYGDDIVKENGPIPMHLLGNIWAQTWNDIADIVAPFPQIHSENITEEMVDQGYSALKMFQMGDDFFQSLNMTKLPETFWKKSILVKPKDGRELVCHASAWDFYKDDDVRIKMCTKINFEDFLVVHHELGHIQYYLQYKDQPSVFRNGANPGFHEAVGDVLSLSVSTSKHLKRVNLLKDYKYDEETMINKLFMKALEKIVFLPFAYTMDKYRWGLFRGEIKPEEYNCAFWKMRDQYSGIEPPVQRSEQDFDAPAKYHISADVEYLRYLVAVVLQFQFYKTACEKAGQYQHGNPELPLYDCDIYGSPEAGNAFKEMLQLGSSKPWPDALEVFVGQRKMSIQPLMEYFEPLRIWLEKENAKNKVPIGWEKSTKCG